MISQTTQLCIHAGEAGKCEKCFDEFGRTVFAEDPENPGLKLSYGRLRQLFREGKQPQNNMKALNEG